MFSEIKKYPAFNTSIKKNLLATNKKELDSLKVWEKKNNYHNIIHQVNYIILYL